MVELQAEWRARSLEFSVLTLGNCMMSVTITGRQSTQLDQEAGLFTLKPTPPKTMGMDDGGPHLGIVSFDVQLSTGSREP